MKSSVLEIESYSTKSINHVRNIMLMMMFFPAVITIIFFIIFYLGNSGNRTGAQAISCTRTISSGDPGTVMNTMTNGQTLCLTAGNYTAKANGSYSRITVSGVTLTSAPGATANITGAFEVRGDNNKFMNLKINGDGLPQGTFLIISGADNTSILNNDISSISASRGICIIVGEGGGALSSGPQNTLIEGNRIHNCGNRENDQGIYLNTSRSGLIKNNYIYDNPDFAIQFYRSAQGNIVENNTMDNNKRGVTISSESGYTTSNNNILRNNIITNSKGNIISLSGAQTSYAGYNIDYYWGGGAGTGNQVTGNCTFGAKSGEIRVAPGITYSGNIVGNPNYVNLGAKNFTLNPGSPCAGKGVQVAAVVTPPPPTTPPATPPAPPVSTTPAPPAPPSSGTPATETNITTGNNTSSTPSSVKIPASTSVASDGTLNLDVTGDGVEETVRDINNDGVIDVATELINDNSETVINDDAGNIAEIAGQNAITEIPGTEVEVRVPRFIGYGFFGTQLATIIGLTAIFATRRILRHH